MNKRLNTILLILAALIGVSMPAAASYLPFNTNVNMNVGIGSARPGAALDVNGTVRMTGLTLTGNGAGNGNVLVGNSIGVGTWMAASTLNAGGGSNYWLVNGGAGNVGINTSYAVGIGTSFVGGTGEAALSVMNGNVGIGTWAPRNSLEISGGNIGIGTTFSLNGIGTTSTILTLRGDTSSVYLGYQAGASSSGGGANSAVGYQALSNGGLNNTAVGYQALNATSSAADTAVGEQALVNVNGIHETALGRAAGGGVFGGGYNVNSHDSLYLGSDTVALADGDTDEIVIGAAAVGIGSYSVELGESNITRTQLQGNVGIGTSTPQGGLVVTNGNVGIGTWAPGLMLDVKGTARITGFVLTGNGAANGNVLVGNSVGVGTWMPASTLIVGGGANYWSLTGGTGNVGISTTNTVGIGTTSGVGAGLVVMNGNVGIGTWVPGTTLDINGNFRTSGTTGNTTLNTTGGNVGIGSAAPGQLLDVAGNIRGTQMIDTGVTASSLVYANTTQQLAAVTLGSGLSLTGAILSSSGSNYWSLAGGTGNVGISTVYSVGIGTTFGAGAGLVVMNGNVGIGTWNPISMLQVAGNVGVGTSAIGSTPRELNINNVALFNSEYNNGSPASPITVNWANGNKQAVTLTSTGMTINFTNPPTGIGALQLKVVQDGIGARTVTTWTPSSGTVYWSGGSMPNFTSTPNYLDIVSCYYDGSNYYCATTMNFQ